MFLSTTTTAPKITKTIITQVNGSGIPYSPRILETKSVGDGEGVGLEDAALMTIVIRLTRKEFTKFFEGIEG